MEAIFLKIESIKFFLVQFFNNSYNFYQLLVFLLVVFFSYLTSLLTLKIFRKSKLKSIEIFYPFIKTLCFPILTLLLSTIVYIINIKITTDISVFLFCFKLVFLWFIFRLVKVFPKKSFLFTIISFSIITLGILNILGFSSGDLTFDIGSFSFAIQDILGSIAIFFMFIWLSGQFSSRIEKLVETKWDLPPNAKDLLIKVTNIGTFIVLGFVMLNILGVNLAKFAFVSGAIGIGVGFGLKNIFSNSISGFILLLDRSIEKGNIVEIEHILGTVTHIGVRNTIIKSFDGKEVLIPNEKFIGDKVINWTLSNKLIRIKLKIGVSYNSNLHQVKKIIEKVLSENKKVALKPESNVYLNEFSDSSVNFIVLFWITDVSSDYYNSKDSVLFNIWDAFLKNGIEIPYPQMDITLKK